MALWTLEQALHALDEPTTPQPGAIYRYFEGGLFQIICCGVKEDDFVPVVVYRSLEDDIHAGVLPLEMFLGRVQLGKNAWVDRFTRENA